MTNFKSASTAGVISIAYKETTQRHGKPDFGLRHDYATTVKSRGGDYSLAMARSKNMTIQEITNAVKIMQT